VYALNRWNVSVVVDEKGDFARRTGRFKPVDRPAEDAPAKPGITGAKRAGSRSVGSR